MTDLTIAVDATTLDKRPLQLIELMQRSLAYVPASLTDYVIPIATLDSLPRLGVDINGD